MNILLKNHQSPGDVIMLTAAVRDIKRWYPEFQIGVETTASEFWLNNPHITRSWEGGGAVTEIDMEYPLIHEVGKQDVHFLHGFIDFFNKRMGTRVKLTEFRGDLYLTDKEKNQHIVGGSWSSSSYGPYWVMVAGGKPDFPAKMWWPEAWQAVVDATGVQIVTIGGKESDHIHPELTDVINIVGKTTLRESLSVIYNAEGVVCPVTYAMHVAACFGKPCVVVAGGREHWWWEKYPDHHFFHTCGLLDCCSGGGCWKGKCDQLDDDGHQKCLAMIDPQKVAEAINGY